MQAELQKPKYTKEQIVSWINRFKYGDVDDIEYQKQIIDTFINAIYVFDDKLVFTYNFKDGTEAIPLKAVEDAFGSDLTQVAPPDKVKTMSLDLFLFHLKLHSVVRLGSSADSARFLFQVLWCDKQNKRKETDRNHSDCPGIIEQPG